MFVWPKSGQVNTVRCKFDFSLITHLVSKIKIMYLHRCHMIACYVLKMFQQWTWILFVIIQLCEKPKLTTFFCNQIKLVRKKWEYCACCHRISDRLFTVIRSNLFSATQKTMFFVSLSESWICCIFYAWIMSFSRLNGRHDFKILYLKLKKTQFCNRCTSEIRRKKTAEIYRI